MTFFLKSFEDTLKQVRTCLNVESKNGFILFLIFCFFLKKPVFFKKKGI